MNKLGTPFTLSPWKEGQHRGCFFKAMKKLMRDHGIPLPTPLQEDEPKVDAKWRLVRARERSDSTIYSMIFESACLPAVLALFDLLFDEKERGALDDEFIWDSTRLRAELVDFSGGQSVNLTVKPYTICSSLQGTDPAT
jgi:hypothetical protein